MRASLKVALGGVLMALAVIIMSFTTVFPFASFAAPALAGIILLPICIYVGKKWAFVCYIGVTLLSFFLSSDHTAVISFTVLLGYYPILKGVIEKLRKRVLEYVLKFLLFNVSIIIGVLLTVIIFGFEILKTEYAGFGALGLVLFLLGGNVVFLLYDRALTGIVTVIILRLIPLLDRLK